MLRTVPTVLTIGHSTRTLDAFVEILQAHGIQRLVDVRAIPRSRRNPHFNRETLPGPLRAVGIGYEHMPALGGLRRPDRDSPNIGWQNASFRGFADYMLTPPFEAALSVLIQRAREEPVAIMCAEAVPWRCHRSLIADALTVCGAQVEHIMSKTRRATHELTPWAKVNGMRITYPAQDEPLVSRRRDGGAASGS
jgi:uncharacterized protein (DUF488 family)